jgi:FKBP-type peptidyl-prolyl cis-trans isomerase FklB
MMQFRYIGVALSLALTSAFGAPLLAVAPAQSDDKAALKSDDAKAAYIMGHQTGANFKRNGVELDVDSFLKGLKAGVDGKDSTFSQSETQTIMESFQKKVTAKRDELRASEGKVNKEAGAQFLEANKKKEGVKVTASGLQYKVITEGKGKKPSASDTVTTHYKGTLIDGKVFDSSYDRGEPATFPVSGVIKGWTEALQMMPVGSKWELYIPSELAYGSRGAGADIGPDATLVFEVELISIKEKEAAKTDK